MRKRNAAFWAVLVMACLMLGVCGVARAQTTHGKWDGFCEEGGIRINTAGQQSNTKAQASRPACTVTVHDSGTTNLSAICSDRLGPSCTPKANPFVADSTSGYAFFYAAPGRYTLTFTSGTSPNTYAAPFVRSDITIPFASQSSFNLTVREVDGSPLVTNVSTLQVSNGTLVDNGAGTVTVTTGGGITTLNGLTAASQTFAAVSDTNVTLNISSAVATHTWTMGWSGLLAATRGGTGIGSYTTGDTLYASNSTTLTKLAIGSSGQCLRVSGGLPIWQNCAGNVSGTGTPTEMAYWTASDTLGSAPAVFVNGNATIEWRRGTYTTPTVLVDGASITSDWAGKNRFRVTLGGNRTLANPTNPADGQQVVYEIIEDGTGGRTLAFDTKFAFGSEISTCNINTTVNKRSYISALYVQAVDRFMVVSCITGY